MRWLILTTLLFLSLTEYTLSAQAAAVFNDTMLVRITQRLQLTDDQVPQVETMLVAYQNDLIDNPPVSPEEKRTRKRALRGRIMAILTPEQKARMKARRSGGGKKNSSPQQKRHWLDVIIDDVASPLLDRRKRSRNGG